MTDAIERDRTGKRGRLTARSAIVAKIKAHASEIHERGVSSLTLFGSRTRGDERHDSDLDVLIEYGNDRPFTLYDLVGVERLLEGLTGLKVHVTTRDGFQPKQLCRVLKGAVDVL